MATRRKKPQPEVELEAAPEVEPEPEVFGPYVLAGDANRLLLATDPLTVIDAGDEFTTTEPALAALLDQHPAVERKDA